MALKGIYMISIKGRKYIGKDSKIDKKNRLRTHLYDLKHNKHWNKELQEDFNKYGIDYLEYEELEVFGDDKTDEYSCEREVYWIDFLGSYRDGYNKTLGGIGGNGLVLTKEMLEVKSKNVTGEKNPQSKLTNAQFFEIVELLKQGKTNKYIAEIYGLHDRYVSLIRHKKRFKRLWEQVEDYTPEKSNGQQRGITYEEFLLVVKMINEGYSDIEISKKFNMNSSSVTRIRQKNLYKRFWNDYECEQRRSTTIQSSCENQQQE